MSTGMEPALHAPGYPHLSVTCVPCARVHVYSTAHYRPTEPTALLTHISYSLAHLTYALYIRYPPPFFPVEVILKDYSL